MPGLFLISMSPATSAQRPAHTAPHGPRCEHLPGKDGGKGILSVYEQTKLKSQSLEVNTGLNMLGAEIKILIQ